MRISDWSSDVCSSDLVAGQRAEFLVNALDQLGCRGRAAISDRLERREVVFGPVRMLDQLPGDRRHPAGEIGRASCRERGGQYGYISVVGGSLKKKKNKVEYSIQRL